MQLGAVDVVFDVRGGAQTRPAGRIELFDQDVHIIRGLLGADVAGRGGQAQHFQVRIEKCQGHGKGAVDAGIAHQDDFFAHDGPPFAIAVRPKSGASGQSASSRLSLWVAELVRVRIF